jgi:hypothetical protein
MRRGNLSAKQIPGIEALKPTKSHSRLFVGFFHFLEAGERRMIDIHTEDLVLLGKAATLLPGRTHRSTLERWRLVGRRGVKLETVLIGGQRYTSKQALARFAEAVTLAADGPQQSPPPVSKSHACSDRTAAIEQAEAYLASQGIR